MTPGVSEDRGRDLIDRLFEGLSIPERLTEQELLELLSNPAHVSANDLFDFWNARLLLARRQEVKDHVLTCGLCHRRLIEARRRQTQSQEQAGEQEQPAPDLPTTVVASDPAPTGLFPGAGACRGLLYVEKRGETSWDLLPVEEEGRRLFRRLAQTCCDNADANVLLSLHLQRVFGEEDRYRPVLEMSPGPTRAPLVVRIQFPGGAERELAVPVQSWSSKSRTSLPGEPLPAAALRFQGGTLLDEAPMRLEMHGTWTPIWLTRQTLQDHLAPRDEPRTVPGRLEPCSVSLALEGFVMADHPVLAVVSIAGEMAQ